MTKLKYYAIFIADTEEDYIGVKKHTFSNNSNENGFTVYFPDLNQVTGGWSLNESIYMAYDLLAGIYYNSLEEDFGQYYDIKLEKPMTKEDALNVYLKENDKDKLEYNDTIKLIELDTESEYFKLSNMNDRAYIIDDLYSQNEFIKLDNLYKDWSNHLNI